MCKSKLSYLSLLIALIVMFPVQAKAKIRIDGPAPPASGTAMGDKAAQAVANFQVVAFSGPPAAL